jgi:hypothetical protein
MAPRDDDPSDFEVPSVKLERFMKAATDQIGTKYQFGAEASFDDPHPPAFDSSELVEWAAHQAGMPQMPDGSWNQYRYLHDVGATVSFDEAMQTRGALVFGFSSDPLASPDRPAHAYVGISLGNGKVLDISERSGQLKVMDPGGFYSYGAKIPEFHTPDDVVRPDDPFAPSSEPAKSYAPDGHIIHEDLPPPTDPVYIPGAGPSQPPADASTTPSDASSTTTTPTTPAPSEPQASTADDPEDEVCSPGDGQPDGQPDTPQASFPEDPEDNVSYPGDDNIGPLSVDDTGDDSSTDPAYADDASSYDAGDAYETETYGDDADAGTDPYGGADSYASSDSYESTDSYAGDASASDDASYPDMSTSDV